MTVQPTAALAPAGHAEGPVLSPVFESLMAAPTRFEPMTALRIAGAEAARLGFALEVETPATTAFVETPVQAVRLEDGAVVITASLAGLVGPLSPLPLGYTEIVAASTRRRSRALGRFLDLFAMRLTTLFLEAGEKYNLPALLQWRPADGNTIRHALHSLIGFGTEGLRQRSPAGEDGLLRYAGLLAQRRRSAEGLRTLLMAEFALAVRIEQFRPRWVAVPESEQTSMRGGAAVLGRNVMAGARFLDRSSGVRIVIGPVRYATFLALEPGRDRMERIRRLARLYLGPALDFDIQVILDRRDVPETQLGAGGPGVRLGWNAWARGLPAARDSDEAIVQCGL
ncbi:MAG: type VI secretion system baseplate subunit TssG [Pseudomonadota bacterium]